MIARYQRLQETKLVTKFRMRRFCLLVESREGEEFSFFLQLCRDQFYSRCDTMDCQSQIVMNSDHAQHCAIAYS